MAGNSIGNPMTSEKLSKEPFDKFRGTITLKGFNSGGEVIFSMGF